MKRKIININADKCNGCGVCIPNCPEGAIQMIDNKARLVSDLFCDGLGACLGHCPEGAIIIEEREAQEYSERMVMENIVKCGSNTILAHLKHLKEHGEENYLKEAVMVLKEKGLNIPDGFAKEEHGSMKCGCPGSMARDLSKKPTVETSESGKRGSELTQWPLQLHLINPGASTFTGKDLLLSADCVAYSLGDFHKDYLKGKALTIACPKLDSEQEIYREKITSLIDDAKINTLTVMIMEVPCCRGLLRLASDALEKATRKIPIKAIVVGVDGEIKSENWI